MTHLAHRSRLPRRVPFGMVAISLLLSGSGLPGVTVGQARAADAPPPPPAVRQGWDDFEFAQALISKGYNEYARRVLDGVLTNEKRAAADRERAKYGMALLGKAEVISAARNAKAPWSEVTSKMAAALASIDDFVAKAAQDPKADEARFEAGSLRLWFVDWASGVSQDATALTDRATTAQDVLSEAQRQIGAAIKSFGELRTNAKRAQDKEIAEYQYVTASYFKGLVYPKCSPEAQNAFAAAKTELENYAWSKEGFLTGVFAQDYLGKTFQELGDCASEEKARWVAYRDALNWFTAAAATEDQGDDYRKVITLGYLHIGQLANHVAGDRPPITDSKARDLLKEARQHLKDMLVKAPRANKLESGILALVELGLIEWKLEDAGAAVQILKKASDFAQTEGFDGPRNRANSVLAQIVTGGGASSTGAAPSDPSVVYKVAEDLYAKGKWAEAVAAYQQVLRAALMAPTPETLKTYVYPSWSRIGSSYANLKLYLEAATAFDAIVDEVRVRRIVGAGEADRTTRLAVDAMNRVRLLLKEIADRTGEPGWRARLNTFTEEQIELLKILLPDGGGSAGELSFRRARDLFDGARRQKDENASGPAWRKAFQDARPYFVETAKNVKSENQDVAWVYLARIAYETGEWDGVAKSADEAAAYWATPEAKRRVEEDERVRGARRGHEAALAFWKAAALVEAKKPQDALGILDGYVKTYGRAADAYYRGRAMGLRVETLAGLGRIDEAEKAFEDLIREVPDYYNIPKILNLLAGHYQDQVITISKKIAELDKEWLGPVDDRSQGIRSRLLAAEKRETALVGTLSDLNQTVERIKRELAERVNLPALERETLQKELVQRQAQQKETRDALTALRAELGTMSKRRDELDASRTALRREQVPPLRKSADLYRKLDDAIKDVDAKSSGKKYRRHENVYVLAFKYVSLGRIEPDTAEHWARARDLYEDYLGLPSVKAESDESESKRRAHREIGEVYVRLAELAEAAGKADEARTSYAAAVRYLQPTLARMPENTAILVGHMAGDVAVLPYADALSSRTWRIPVRKVTDVQAFRDYVKDLGGDRLPKYANDRVQADFVRAVGAFQRAVAAMPPATVQRTVASLKDAGFDAAFYGDHGVTDTDFLLTLARGYARSGVAENAWRAVNAA
ncbi:MAG TPA: hypothetical protein VND21_07185, partial [Planctomycetota bacterium]|nr:hypothetical protein [Planctomycetota bacterium]